MTETEAASPAAEQLSLVRGVPPRRPRAPVELAVNLPVARVAVDLPLAHLDRPFDYAVPETMTDTALPGVRVRVRFAGQDVDGFVVDRAADSDHVGRLTPLRRVVSAEPVLTPSILRVARQVADQYAGTLADVLRLAVPPRHARAEKEVPRPARPTTAATGDVGADARWGAYENGAQLVHALTAGASPGAVWAALRGADPVSGEWPRWPGDLAAAVHACVRSGRGALVVVPDRRDVDLVSAALDRVIGPGQHVALTADVGPQARYRGWLSILRGAQRVVVGTRAAAFAPVADLGLVAIWDDGDDLHAEPRAPYPHAREVLLLRATETGAGFLVGGVAVTAEGAELVRSGRARAVAPTRAQLRATSPLVRIAGDEGQSERHAAADRGRLPGLAFDTARAALAAGPVLVQVPRAGYVPALACARCRTPARCSYCHGPLELRSRGATPMCGWCARLASGWRCPECSFTGLRAPVVGAGRTAEELGRAFPSVPVISSGGDRVLARVGSGPALVVATPGAEPIADGGYAAALLLDGWALLGRADLRAGEEALRRWFAATALVRSGVAGGKVVLMAPPGARAPQSLVRADPFGAADRELTDRSSAGFPPAATVATITGDHAAVAELLAAAHLPDGVETLGPVPVGDEQQLVVRTSRAGEEALAAALHAALSLRSARKSAGVVRVQVNPAALG